MALFQTKLEKSNEGKSLKNDVVALIQQRRYQLLVHSLLYYELDFTVVSDEKWSKWAQELVKLQTNHPEESRTVIFFNAFSDFDGSTGFNLPYRDEQIVNIAYRVLKIAKLDGDLNAEEAILNLRSVKPTPAEYTNFYSAKSIKPKQVRKGGSKIETHRKKLF